MSLAIAYKMKKKMAKGGVCAAHGMDMCEMCHGGKYASGGKVHDMGVHGTTHYKELKADERKGRSEAGDHVRSASSPNATKRTKEREIGNAKGEHEQVLSELHSMRGQDRKYLADGGKVEPSASPTPTPKERATAAFMKGFKDSFGVAKASDEEEEKKAYGGDMHKYAEGGDVDEEERMEDGDADDLGEDVDHDTMVKGLKEKKDKEVEGWLAEGDQDHESADMVGHIMKERAKNFSKGGRVANDVGQGWAADERPNQFDDLVLDDDLSEHYTGKNSGDEMGDAQEDEDQRDMVSQIMKSRRKKDRLPNPR